MACGVTVSNTGNVRLQNFALSGSVNCTTADTVAVLAPGQSTVCMVQRPAIDFAVVAAGGNVQVDFSNYTVTALGTVPVPVVNAPLTATVELSAVAGWTAPVLPAELQLVIDPDTCTVPAKAGEALTRTSGAGVMQLGL